MGHRHEGAVLMSYTKKTIELDDAILKKLRRQLDVKTDKEAVNLAMQIVTDEGSIIAVHQQLAGKLDLSGPFS
jgi:Arc/MetJ family transcription regulator